MHCVSVFNRVLPALSHGSVPHLTGATMAARHSPATRVFGAATTAQIEAGVIERCIAWARLDLRPMH